MSIHTPTNGINDFIVLSNNLKTSLAKFGITNSEKIKKIEDKFKQQFPEIDEESYKLLQRENKIIGKNHLEVYKSETAFNELINYNFFKIILQDILKENDKVSNIKIYNTYEYTDRKTGVDYTVFIELKNGENIAFGIDLKNGRNSEKNYNEIITGIFTLITQNSKGIIQNHNGIKKNIKISKELYNNVSKQKRKYTLGINNRNQNEINRIVLQEILTNGLTNEIKKLNIFNIIKTYLEQIIENELNAHQEGILGTINYVKENSMELIEKAQELEEEKRKADKKRKKEEKRKADKKRKKEEEKEKKQENEKQRKNTRKYETGKNYTVSKFKDDLLYILDMNNKINISFYIKKITTNINSNDKIKQMYEDIYNSINDNKITIPGAKKTTRIIKLKKAQLNRFKKIYSELQK